MSMFRISELQEILNPHCLVSVSPWVLFQTFFSLSSSSCTPDTEAAEVQPKQYVELSQLVEKWPGKRSWAPFTEGTEICLPHSFSLPSPHSLYIRSYNMCGKKGALSLTEMF
jgi:hypothetical protein